MRITLPAFAASQRIGYMLGGIAVVCLMVLVTLRIHLREPVTLPLSWFDRTIPFFPPAIFVYMSHFPFIGLALWGLHDPLNMNRVLWSMLVATGLASVVFFAYPINLPGHPPLESGGPIRSLFALLYSVDRLNNCFPSLHVAIACLAAWGYWHEQRHLFPFAAIWALSITTSTVLVKQHYFVDIPGGFVLAILSHAVVWRSVDFRLVDSRRIPDGATAESEPRLSKEAR